VKAHAALHAEASVSDTGASSFEAPDQNAPAPLATPEADLPSTSTTESTATTMADSPTIVSTPYPTYIPGNDNDSDEVFKAALIQQGDASTQRNQDSQFAALRDQLVNRDVNDGKRETAQAKYDLAVQSKDAEIRNGDRFAEVSKELSALRAEMSAREVAQLRVELAESKADGRQAKTESLLATILAKLPV
jgi:hypothetical protein